MSCNVIQNLHVIVVNASLSQKCVVSIPYSNSRSPNPKAIGSRRRAQISRLEQTGQGSNKLKGAWS